MAPTVPVVPNRLTGETAPNTLRGTNQPTSPSPASAPGGGVVPTPRTAAGWLRQRWLLALVIGAVVVYVVFLLLAPA